MNRAIASIRSYWFHQFMVDAMASIPGLAVSKATRKRAWRRATDIAVVAVMVKIANSAESCGTGEE